MNWKKVIPLALSAAMAISVAGCTSSPTQSPSPSQTPQSTQTSGSIGDASNPAILVVSFGTSFNESRDLTIGAIESAVQAAYPDNDVRRAFTSQTIIDKLKKRDGLEIDNVEEALDRLVADGVKELVVQPTHVMNGYEYDDLAAAVESYRDKFDKVALGEPLLTSDEDYAKMIEIITSETADLSNDETAIVFMGHGTEHAANATYGNLQNKLTEAGYKNYFIGTVEATPSLDEIVALVKAGGYSKVVLEPLMVVAGDHANNDMAGDEPDSWKSVLEAEGLEVTCLIRGLGEFEGVQQQYVSHVKDAMEQLG